MVSTRTLAVKVSKLWQKYCDFGSVKLNSFFNSVILVLKKIKYLFQKIIAIFRISINFSFIVVRKFARKIVLRINLLPTDKRAW